jgi:hypothetical protein
VHRVEYTLVGLPVARAGLLQQTAEKAKLRLLVDDPVKQAMGLRFPFTAAPGLKGVWTLENL